MGKNRVKLHDVSARERDTEESINRNCTYAGWESILQSPGYENADVYAGRDFREETVYFIT